MAGQSRYFEGVFYPESAIDNWQTEIYHILQVPFVYCIHDKDITKEGDPRKTHVHIIIIFANTTTEKHAKNTINRLTRDNCVQCCPRMSACINIRHCYDYLIHATEDSQKKFQYKKTERICGNSFDIGAYEQIALAEKEEYIDFVANMIIEQHFCNILDLYNFVTANYCSNPEKITLYRRIIRTNISFFTQLTKGNYLKMQLLRGVKNND